MPGQPAATAPTTLFKAGCFDNDNINALNTNLTNVNTAFTNTIANSPGLVGTPINGTVAFGNYTTAGTAVTLVAATAPAGTYRITIYAVVTTLFTGATALQHNLGWTDDKQAQTQTNALSALTAGTNQIITTTVRSNGTAAITLTEVGTVSNATAGAMALSAFVERLV